MCKMFKKWIHGREDIFRVWRCNTLNKTQIYKFEPRICAEISNCTEDFQGENGYKFKKVLYKKYK